MKDAELERALAALMEGRESSAPADPAELARLRSELSQAGAVLCAQAFARPRDEARFVARVLARTTREDLSWKGDLILWRDYLRARLKASPALRLVAASLVLHLVAAPAVAYWMLREAEPKKPLLIHVEPPSSVPFDEGEVLAQPDDELLAAARAREARENARAETRFWLSTRGASLAPLALEPEAPLELVLLARHVTAVATRTAPDAGALPEEASELARALWLELELDRAQFGATAVTSAAGRVALELALRLPEAPDGVRDFLAASLRRAWAEGLLDSAPSAAPAPLAPAWFEALAAAARTALGAAGAPLERWCQDACGK